MFTCILRMHASECLHAHRYRDKSVHAVYNISCATLCDVVKLTKQLYKMSAKSQQVEEQVNMFAFK